jgi:hypothetical protein
VEILVDNAAVVWPLGPSVGVDIDEWAAVLAINVAALPGSASHFYRTWSRAAGGE